MQISMHLMFDGNCREAFELYARVFGGTIVGIFPYGTSPMAIQETFWSRAFGMLVDRFGIPWEINCETPVAAA